MRHLLSLVSAGLMLTALTACGSSDDGNTNNAGDNKQAGPWSFVDGSGKTVQLDRTPTRIIAHAGEAAALMTYGIRPIGIYADESVQTEPNLQGLDLSGIEILGEEWGVINVEKAVELDPDLIVADWWPAENAHSGLEKGVKEESKKIGELAPVVGASQGKSILELSQGYEKLAASLGANVSDPKFAKDKQRFEQALTKFKNVTSAKKDLTVLAVSPASDLLYVANPVHAPELLDFQQWGLKVMNPDSPNPEFPYWENLSWENADKYQPDLLLIDSRKYDSSLEEAAKHPTWQRINAAKKGAVVKWPAFWLHTYGHYADALEALAADVEKADANIGT